MELVWLRFGHPKMVTPAYNPAPTVDQNHYHSKASQTIAFSAISNQNLSAGTYTLEANASSGEGVSFTSSDSTIVSIVGNVATLVKGGTVQVTATKAVIQYMRLLRPSLKTSRLLTTLKQHRPSPGLKTFLA